MEKVSNYAFPVHCDKNTPMIGAFPSQRANNTESTSKWWRHHGITAWVHCVHWESTGQPTQRSTVRNWDFFRCQNSQSFHYLLHLGKVVAKLRRTASSVIQWLETPHLFKKICSPRLLFVMDWHRIDNSPVCSVRENAELMLIRPPGENVCEIWLQSKNIICALSVNFFQWCTLLCCWPVYYNQYYYDVFVTEGDYDKIDAPRVLLFVFNTSWSIDAIVRHRSESKLAQVMVCCLTAPNHYLNQCWLIIREVLWHLHDSNFKEMLKISILDMCLKITDY